MKAPQFLLVAVLAVTSLSGCVVVPPRHVVYADDDYYRYHHHHRVWVRAHREWRDGGWFYVRAHWG